MRIRIGYYVVGLLFLFGRSTATERVKRDGDFLSNLGTTLNRLVGSFLGYHPSDNPQGQQPFQILPTAPVQNSPIVQPQIQNSQDLPTLGTNSQYDRRVAHTNAANRKNPRPGPYPQPNFQPQPQFQGGRPHEPDRQPRIIDENGHLSYCSDNPADCAYLSCLAENFQKSEQAKNLQMAGKVFLDRNLRRAVANDPLISQAACDKVGLDGEGCKGFRQLLGLIDQFDPGPSSKEMSRDPERQGRRKRDDGDLDVDFEVPDTVLGERAVRQAQGWPNQGPNGQVANQGFGQNQNQISQGQGFQRENLFGNQQSNGQGQPQHGNQGWQGQPGTQSNRPSNNGQGQGLGIGNRNQNGNRPNIGPNPPRNTRPPPANWQTTQRPHHGHIDYSEYYEHGPSAGRGGGGGGSGPGPAHGGGGGGRPSGSSETEFRPKDCKAIVRNARQGG